MGRKCSISDCPTKYYKNGMRVSSFRPPSDIELYKKWEEAIKSSGNTLNKNSCVCEKHFRKEDIRKECILKDLSGNVLFRKTLKKPRLSLTAIPTIFDKYDENEEKSYDDSKKMLQPLLAVAQDSLSGPSSNDISTTLVNDNRSDKYTNSLGLNAAFDNESINHSYLPCENSTPVNAFNFVSVMDDKTGNISSVESDTCGNSIIQREFFEIFSNCLSITSSHNQWAIHKVNEPRKLLIAAKKTPLFIEESKAPIIDKQIVLGENGKCQTFILDKLLDLGDNYVNSLEEFQLLIGLVDSWHICVGGPSILQYKNVHCISAYKDITNKWRHNLCELVIERGTICKECVKVDSNLRRNLLKVTKRKRPANIRLTLPPTKRTHNKVKKEAARITTQALRRSNIRCQAMKDGIRNTRNTIAKIHRGFS